MQLLSPIRPVVEAILTAVLAEDIARQQPSPEVWAATVDGVLHKVQEMPRALGLGMAAMTLAVEGAARPAAGARLSALPAERRRALLERIRSLPVPVGAMFMEFYERMGAFVFYSELERARG